MLAAFDTPGPELPSLALDDPSDPAQVAEYAHDIFEYLFQAEVRAAWCRRRGLTLWGRSS